MSSEIICKRYPNLGELEEGNEGGRFIVTGHRERGRSIIDDGKINDNYAFSV